MNEEFLKIRDVIIANRKPRKLEVQPEVYLKDGKVVYKDFEDSFEGVIESQVEHHRFADLENVYDQWHKDKDLFFI